MSRESIQINIKTWYPAWLVKHLTKKAIEKADKAELKSLIDNYKPALPLIWWIDDLSHRTCGLVDDPIHGLNKLPWPDCEKVYLAIDKREYDKMKKALEYAVTELECLNKLVDEEDVGSMEEHCQILKSWCKDTRDTFQLKQLP